MKNIFIYFILSFTLIIESFFFPVFEIHAAEVSNNQFVNKLFVTGQLGLTDLPARSIFLEQTACSKIDNSGPLDQQLKLFCDVVTKSDNCKNVKSSELMSCKNPTSNVLDEGMDFVKGCLTGLFHSVKDFLNFIYEAGKFIYENVTDFKKATQTADKVSQFSNSIKLYIYTEYDKAYQTARFPKGLRAASMVAEKALTFIVKSIFEKVKESYYEFGCLNSEAKSERLCKLVGDFVIPPAALFGFLKKGAEAAKAFPTLERALTKLRGFPKFAPFLERLGKASRVLGKNLSIAEQEAIIAAHMIGAGEKGANGAMAQVGNYTQAQLTKKARILKEAGFSSEDIRKLMEGGIVGLGPEELKSFTKLTPSQHAHNSFLVKQVPSDPFVSFADSSGTRVAGKIESVDPITGAVKVKLASGGEPVTLSREQVASLRNSETSKKYFQELEKHIHSSLDIPIHPNSNYENIRQALRQGNIPTDPFVSFESAYGERLGGKITSIDKSTGKVTIQLVDGNIHTVEGEALATIRQSETAKAGFVAISNPIRLESHPEAHYQVIRESLNKGEIPKDPYVSFLKPDGTRVAGKIAKVDAKSGEVLIFLESGGSTKIKGEALESMRQSSSAKQSIQMKEAVEAHFASREPTPSLPSSSRLPKPEVMLKYDLEPKFALKTSNADFKVSSFFTDGDGRVFVITDVTVNGETSRRVFYRSNSSASFRNLPARNTKVPGMPGYDKGPGEEFLAAPSELQSFLAEKLQTAPAIQKMPTFDPKELEGIIPNNKNFDEYMKYHNDPNSIYAQAKNSREIISHTDRPLTSSAGHQYAKPQDVIISNPMERPNFKSPKNTYKLKTETYGEVQAFVYPSADGKLEYTLLKDASGKVWFSDVGSVAGGINSHGLRVEAVTSHELLTPRWEYHQQIPSGYGGAVNPVKSSYSDAWSYIKEMPEIKRWYFEQGLPIPK